MSQAPPGATSAATPHGGNVGASASGSEKNARPKVRSCVVCRSRKVRCDKQSPCSNCRRANIPCVFPATDRPPRWARRLDLIANKAAANAANPQAAQDADPGVSQVMERLRTLEGLVKELTGQLEQAHAAANSASGSNAPSDFSPLGNLAHGRDTEKQPDVPLPTSTGNVQTQFGRLVLHDANRSRYVSSGFWSRVNDELNGLKMDTRSLALDDSESSGDEMSPEKTPSTQELERTPSERHAFLFRHNLGPAAPNLREFHPLPSQIPFIINVFAENVNIIQMVHVPTITKMVRDLRVGDMARLTPANEALLFSLYYAAITSMEEDDIVTNFGATKTELNLKYRLGLEHALAKADFLSVPDIVLVQAFAIFLLLVRRHDSPRFVWMMTGLVIRMAQALGLHRDGAHFETLTPYEVEIRRRVWWGLCVLDVRASEDQGMDLTITTGSFDTKLPLNINDADIEPGSKVVPTEREGLTDMSFALTTFEICQVTRQMMALAVKDGAAGLDEQERLLKEIYQKFERGYFQYSSLESGNIMLWVGATATRLVISKMTLIVYLPVLFSSPSEHFSDDIRDKLFVAAIEVAEYNHALNAEQECRHWRWLYQTYTHWHAIVYLLIEISRRPWSPTVERAWVALHSRWLIPAQLSTDKNLRTWVPLRKLMAKARKHHDAELERLRSDSHAAERLEAEDRKMPLPGSPGPFPAGANVVELFRERWRQLVAMPERPGDGAQTSGYPGEGASTVDSVYTSQSDMGSIPGYSTGGVSSSGALQAAHLGVTGQQPDPNLVNSTSSPWGPNITATAPGEVASGQTTVGLLDWSDGRTMGPGFVPWLWADSDPSADVFANVNVDALDLDMDLDGEVNWHNWVESARGMEWDVGPGGGGQA